VEPCRNDRALASGNASRGSDGPRHPGGSAGTKTGAPSDPEGALRETRLDVGRQPARQRLVVEPEGFERAPHDPRAGAVVEGARLDLRADRIPDVVRAPDVHIEPLEFVARRVRKGCRWRLDGESGQR